MSRRRIWSWVGGVAIVLSLASCTRGEAPKAVAPDLSYLPQDSVFVVGVDVTRLRETPLYQSLRLVRQEESIWTQLRNLLDKLGVVFEEDVERALYSHRGAETGPGAWVLVLRGRFEAEVLEDRLEEPDARMSTEPYRRWVIHNLVEIPGVGDLSLVLVDDTALALGSTSGLRRLLDIREGTTPALVSNESMTSAAEGLAPAAQIWALMDVPEVLKLAQERMPGAGEGTALPGWGQFSALRVGRVWGVFSKDLDARLEVAADTEENAKNLAEGVEGLLALGKMRDADEGSAAAKVLDAVRVSHERTLIQVAVALDGETVTELWGKMPPSVGEDTPLEE